MPLLRIPYGVSEYSPGSRTLEAAVATPLSLRLNNSRYEIDELPEAARSGTVAERLAYLRDYHEELCGDYARRPRQFIALYFRLIDAVMAATRPALEEKAARFGGLFGWQDYAFSALRPLPRAHVPTDGGFERADFAFWTGPRLVVIDLAGETRGPSWSERCRRLETAGASLIELPTTALVGDDPQKLQDFLPPEIAVACLQESMPSAPFKTAPLGEIVSEEPEF